MAVGGLDVLALEEVALALRPALNALEGVVETDAGLLASHIGYGGKHLKGVGALVTVDEPEQLADVLYLPGTEAGVYVLAHLGLVVVIETITSTPSRGLSACSIMGFTLFQSRPPLPHPSGGMAMLLMWYWAMTRTRSCRPDSTHS